ncbi:MAG TPA: ABC transporter permease [Candidatus Krumholzibacteria bacterium]|nr:ABC transporter permease [Candidatus Krumholzibacteria bacterium]
MQTPSRQNLWSENFAQAIEVMRAHRLRSALLILGVAIGIATVLMMVTVLSGLSKKIYQDMASANRPYIYVQKFDFVVEGENAEELSRRADFTREDAAALARTCPSVDAAVFMIESQGTYSVRYGAEKTPPTTVLGSSHRLPELFSVTVDRGRFFTESEERFNARVAVLAAGPAKDLFNQADPIGRYVMIGGAKYQVIGTMAPRNSIFGAWSDNFVCVPHTTFGKDLHTERDWITLGATVRDDATLEQGVEEVTRALRVQRGLRPGQENDFSVETSESFLDLVKKVTVPIGIVLTIIASIGLLVGGIGVMNVMLISVTERTREIGVRRAIGAARGDVMRQFLIEAGTLTGVGGVVGVVAGTALALGVSKLIHFPFVFSLPWTIVSLLFSVLVGIGFGLYPARRAGDMDPVTALRHE